MSWHNKFTRYLTSCYQLSQWNIGKTQDICRRDVLLRLACKTKATGIACGNTRGNFLTRRQVLAHICGKFASSSSRRRRGVHVGKVHGRWNDLTSVVPMEDQEDAHDHSSCIPLVQHRHGGGSNRHELTSMFSHVHL